MLATEGCLAANAATGAVLLDQPMRMSAALEWSTAPQCLSERAARYLEWLHVTHSMSSHQPAVRMLSKQVAILRISTVRNTP